MHLCCWDRVTTNRILNNADQLETGQAVLRTAWLLAIRTRLSTPAPCLLSIAPCCTGDLLCAAHIMVALQIRQEVPAPPTPANFTSKSCWFDGNGHRICGDWSHSSHNLTDVHREHGESSLNENGPAQHR